MKFHTSQFPCTRGNNVNLVALRRIEGSLLGKTSTSSAASRFQFEGFSCSFINSHVPRIRYKRCEFVFDRYIFQSTHLENNTSFWLNVGLYWRDYHETSYFGHPRLRRKRCNLDCYWSFIKGTLVEDKVPFSLYFRVCRGNFPETAYFAISALAELAM